MPADAKVNVEATVRLTPRQVSAIVADYLAKFGLKAAHVFHGVGAKKDGVYIKIRGSRNGGDFRGPQVEELGWWTLGMSFTPDGQVHYYASPGVDDLTADDYVTSQFPYNYRVETFKTFFFNVCTRDDGKTWSTPWVVDDPKVYVVQPLPVARSRSSTTR